MANEEVINIDVLDKRLTDDGIEWYCEWTKGGDPSRRILVDGNTPLDKYLEDVNSSVKKHGEHCRIGILSMLAHGWAEYEYSDREQKKQKALHGGFGMEFCKERLTMETVERFKVLKGLFSSKNVGIKLMGCAAAAEYLFRVYPGGPVKQGFGKKLCRKLAEVTDTSVMASESLQSVDIDRNPRTYRWGADIREIKSCVKFGPWEGTVWIFSPDGKMEKASP